MSRRKQILPIAVLIGSVLLLQVHGIQFWRERVGLAGIAWSILFELIAFWNLYQKSKPRRAFGLVVSALLLAGPLHAVTQPLFHGLETTAQARAAMETERKLLRKQIAEMEISLETYRQNSEERLGWLPAIQRAEAELKAARERLLALARTAPPQVMDWEQRAFILLQALGLVAFQLSAVMAITTISRISRVSANVSTVSASVSTVSEPRETAGKPEREINPPRQLVSTEAEIDVSELNRRLTEFLIAHRMSHKAFAEEYGYTARDLSLIRNHDQLAAEGKRIAPRHILRKLAHQLGMETR